MWAELSEIYKILREHSRVNVEILSVWELSNEGIHIILRSRYLKLEIVIRCVGTSSQ